MSDAEEKSLWGIKSMPVEARKQATACAAKQGQTMAEWLVRAIGNQANLEAGERILPPLVPSPAPMPQDCAPLLLSRGGHPRRRRSGCRRGFGQRASPA
jgi:hypothetical protein